MKTITSSLLALLMMLAAAWATSEFRPRQYMYEQLPPILLDRDIPSEFGDWRELKGGAASVINPQQTELLNQLYTQTLSRTYVNQQGKRIMLSIAYGRNQLGEKTQVHRPEYCYTAQGFSVSNINRSMVEIPRGDIPVSRLTAKLGSRVEPITYWIVIGSTPISTGLERKRAQFSHGLSGIIPDGMLIRVSEIASEIPASYELQKNFIVALANSLPIGLDERIFGNKLNQKI
jgi:EpsI family protein